MPEPETTHLELTGGASFFSGDIDAQGLSLMQVTGRGKITWPDGTEVDAEQFQDSVTVATIAYAKGRAAGRQEALLEAREDIRERRRTFGGLGGDPQYLAALDDAFGLVNNRLHDAEKETSL